MAASVDSPVTLIVLPNTTSLLGIEIFPVPLASIIKLLLLFVVVITLVEILTSPVVNIGDVIVPVLLMVVVDVVPTTVKV